MYQPQTGDIDGVAFREQLIAALGGGYIFDGGGVAIGSTSASITTQVTAGVLADGYDRVPIGDQTVTHSAGAAGDPRDPTAEWRVDAVVATAGGGATAIEGTPAKLDDGTNPPGETDRRPPNVVRPLPPSIGSNQTLLAHLTIPPGVTSSQGLYQGDLRDRRIPGNALNGLELIPGRNLQTVLDNAREGQTLTGDRSQVITLNKPLSVDTKNVTLRNVTLQYADGASASDNDDMLTLNADGITIENVRLLGNNDGQNYAPDGATIRASGCSVLDSTINHTAGHGINVNGGSRSVQDTTISNVTGDDCAKDLVVVQGTNTYRTTIDTVRAKASRSRGTVTVRNGPRFTSIDGVYGNGQEWTAKLEDFGGESEPITSTSITGLRGGKVQQLLANGLSPSVKHERLAIDTVQGRNLVPQGASGGTGLVDVSNINGAAVSRMYINDPFGGMWGIYGDECPAVSISDSFVRGKNYAYGGYRISDSTGVTISGCRTAPFQDGSGQALGTGILLGANDADLKRASIRDCIIADGVDVPVTLTENGSTISNTKIADNFLYEGDIINNSSGAGVVIDRNLNP